MINELMTAEEVAAALRVPVATLYRWRWAGAGPKARRVGRHLRYRTSDVEAWFDEDPQGRHRNKRKLHETAAGNGRSRVAR